MKNVNRNKEFVESFSLFCSIIIMALVSLSYSKIYVLISHTDWELF